MVTETATPDFVLGLVPGTLLRGQYRIERVLGKPGGFGITYLAEDMNLHRQVAVKEFLPRDLAGRGTDRTTVLPHSQREQNLFEYGLERFIEEGRLLAMLDDHRNIVRVRTAFQANGTAYLVMNFYEGESLGELLERLGGKLAPSQAVGIVRQILNGLSAAHSHGILHRDVKPDNIYLRHREGQEPEALLLDFGAARQAVKDRSQGVTAMLSAGYAPLEQYSRNGVQGSWTDIYACAAVLYELITGNTPPEAPERIEEDPLQPPHLLEKSCPPTLSAAIVKALSMRRQERVQTAAEFDALLGNIAAPTAQRRIRPLHAAVAAGVLLVAAVAAVTIQRAGSDNGDAPVAQDAPDAQTARPEDPVQSGTIGAATTDSTSEPAPPVATVTPPPPQRDIRREPPPPVTRQNPPVQPPISVTPDPVAPALPSSAQLAALGSDLTLGSFHLNRSDFVKADSVLSQALANAASLRASFPQADTVQSLQTRLRQLRDLNRSSCRQIAQVVRTQQCPSGGE